MTSVAEELSAQQSRMWFVHQLTGSHAGQHERLGLLFRGDLDQPALGLALTGLAARHEILRTTFCVSSGRGMQRIAPEAHIELSLSDLSETAGADREAAIQRAVNAELEAPFDLEAAPPWRARLLRLSSSEHVLLIVMHHIISDGDWSFGPLVRELLELYEAARTGQPPQPREVAQYRGYVSEQKAWLEGTGPEEQVAWWKGQLAGAPPALELPTASPRRPVASFRTSAARMQLPRDLVTSLQELARRADTRLSCLLMAAFRALCFRYTGQRDIALGTVTSCRSAAFEATPGDFGNLLVLRNAVDPQEPFASLLARESEVERAALRHRELPFDRLVESFQGRRDLSRTPLFNVLFVMRPEPIEPTQLPGLLVSPVELESHAAQFELIVALRRIGAGIECRFEFDEELYPRESIERLMSHYRTVLRQACENPDAATGELAGLPPGDRNRVLVEWNATDVDWPRGRCIHQLFLQQVQARPDALAVEYGPERLTYAELARRSSRLAHRLRRIGVGRDCLVGISARRSIGMIVSLLAVWMAGGAYVPLDPNYPRQRLAWMIEDSKLSVLLIQRALRELLPSHDARVIELDDLEAELRDEPDSPPDVDVAPNDLAYVIYTSGSTGRPKGVLVEHYGVPNMVQAQQRQLGAGPDSRVLQFSSFSFDASLFEIVMALCSGGCLVLGSQDELMPGADLARLLVEKAVTIAVMPPSALAHLPAEDYPLRTILVAGEACPAEIVERWAGHRAFFNLYGPTETTVWATAQRCLPGSGRPTIGRPIDNTRLYILDELGNPVPIGAPGELCIGGVGLARGYLNRPDLTGQRFVTLSFPGIAPERVYRTGDLVRYRSNGEVEFLGRIDHQVKVRGFRIELGEIETVLGAFPGVREAVVLVRTEPSADPEAEPDARVVAYVVPEDGVQLDVDPLRDHVRGAVPTYMIPSAFVVLPAFPLTPNGKVDRQALPAPGAQDSRAGRYVAPRNALEQQLAELWSQLLRREVGIEDSFFDAGGHSLLAAKALSLVREKFGISLPTRLMFEKPTIAELAQCIADSGAQVTEALTIPALPPQRDYPLSYAQQRIWFVDSIRPGNDAYDCPAAFRLRGAVDAAALEGAVQHLVRRHTSLRTTFVQAGEQLVQRIDDECRVQLERVDLGHLPPHQRDHEGASLVLEVARHEFELSTGPLLRTVLIKLSDDDHLLVINMHHIVCDGWSLGLFLQELASLYRCIRRGESAGLPALPIQYPDFSVWQRDHLHDAIVAPQLAFWRQYLAGAPPLLELPTDFPRPSVPSFKGQRIDARVGAEVLEKLRILGRTEHASVFMTLLAAFDLVLSRHARTEDVVVGIPTAGRNQSEVQGLIGMFANILVARADLSGNPTFRELLGRVRDRTFSAFEHQDIPFERLVEELKPSRDLSYNPIVQVALVPQDMPFDTPSLDGLQVASHPIDRGAAQFDIVVFTREDPSGVSIWAEYASDLFERATVERMLEQFLRVLGEAASDPDQPLSRIRLLDPAARQRAIVDWNQTRTEYPRDACLHRIVRAHAARAPAAVALDFDGELVTYEALHRRANRLARRLQDLGVRENVIVGLSLPSSVDLIVSMLAVLKAGGAYVPLDPSYPCDRLRFMVNDAAMPVIVSREGLADWLDSQGTRVLYLDRERAAIEAGSDDDVDTGTTADSLAYVIYTSGSTGLPKGVCIRHRGVVRLVHNTNHLQLDPDDRVSQIANVSFDAAEAEIWGALLSGARLVGVPRETSLSPEDLAETLQSRGITTVLMTAPLFHQIAAAAPRTFAHVKQLLIGGEALDPRWVRKILETAPPARLINSYGPAESTVCATWHLVDHLAEGASQVPIGRPISNTQVYIVDDRLEPVPPGVPGELVVGGDGLAIGYLNRPSLTDEKFVPHPFDDTPGAKVYRTGDLARYRPDGVIEFLGRVDFQVKIRGVRIEPGEIETVLGTCPGLKQAVVVAREVAPGDRRLLAYAVPAEGQELTARVLKDFLAARLPELMIPSSFMILPELPLTSNMKVDRQALPLPSIERSSEVIGPRTAVEERLVRIWHEVLGVETLGVRDDFFDLGGHSLLATRVLSRVRREFGVRIRVFQFFEAPTIEGLASIIDPDGTWSPSVEEPSIVPTSSFGVISLAWGQRELFRLHQAYPGLAYNVPIALRLRGPVNVEALELSLSELLRRHEPLRTIFRDMGDEGMQIIAGPGPVTLMRRSVDGLVEADREPEALRLATQEARRTFDIEQGPVMRAMIIRIAQGDHLLLINMHHIVSDGWSVGVLFRELSALYEGFCAAKPVTLPTLAIQYRDWVMWQLDWVENEEGAAQLAYWKERLEGAPRLLELPTDRPRKEKRGFEGAQRGFLLPSEQVRLLTDAAQAEGATLFMAVLAAYTVMLREITGQSDLLVATTASSRTKRSSEGLIGCLFNKLALRVELGGNPTFQELIGRVRETTLQAFDHQDLPFELLLESLGVPVDGPVPPLVQVGYAPQDSAWDELPMHKLQVAPVAIDRAMAPLDLILYYQPRGDGLHVWMEYRSDLFDAVRIDSWLDRLQRILNWIGRERTARVGDVAR